MTVNFTASDAAPFPQLRSAYLRAIARSWRDPAYINRLLLAKKTLPQRGALALLEEDYKFKFPFHVRMLIDVKKRPVFRPNDVCGWYGYADEFKLALPARPARKEMEASVLARYYQEFPTLLGKGDINLLVPEAARGKIDMSVGLPLPDSFGAFGLVIGQVIALVWRDKRFARQLLDPELEDARPLVEDATDSLVPWNFNLRFELAGGKSTDQDDYWASFPRTTVTLNLPEKPDLDVEAVALAAYNATGGQYPFSCG
jgi:ribosomally synthesized peptide (two-chain TOMM family)